MGAGSSRVELHDRLVRGDGMGVLAALERAPELAEELDPNVPYLASDALTPLHYACRFGLPTLVSTLLSERFGGDPNVRTADDGCTSLHVACGAGSSSSSSSASAGGAGGASGAGGAGGGGSTGSVTSGASVSMDGPPYVAKPPVAFDVPREVGRDEDALQRKREAFLASREKRAEAARVRRETEKVRVLCWSL